MTFFLIAAAVSLALLSAVLLFCLVSLELHARHLREITRRLRADRRQKARAIRSLNYWLRLALADRECQEAAPFVYADRDVVH